MDREKAVAYVGAAKEFADIMRDKWYLYLLLNLTLAACAGFVWRSATVWLVLTVMLAAYFVVVCVLAAFNKLQHALCSFAVSEFAIAFSTSVIISGVVHGIENAGLVVHLPVAVITVFAVVAIAIIARRVAKNPKRLKNSRCVALMLGTVTPVVCFLWAFSKLFVQYLAAMPYAVKIALSVIFASITVVALVTSLVSSITRFYLAVKYKIKFEEVGL